MKILIIGGYGTFGRRLVDLLLDDPRQILVMSRRDIAKAMAFCGMQTGAAQLMPLSLDRSDCGPALAEQKVDLVVDASGPFQACGDDPCHVVRAVFAAGSDYWSGRWR